jgi:hypothetical protein
MMERVAKRHGFGESGIKGLFGFIVCWELLTAIMYLTALDLYLLGNRVLLPYAFFLGIGLFAGLVLGNETFVYYDDEEEHVVMFLARLVSYIAVVIL